MKKVIGITIVLAIVAGIAIAFTLPKNDKNPARKAGELKGIDFHDLTIISLDGTDSLNFANYKGKKVLCVNVASKCGYTYQYKNLQKLHEKYKDKLVIIGFPCNQFLGQEAGTAEEIENFSNERNYEKLVSELVFGNLPGKIFNVAKNIAPIKRIEIMVDENGNLMAHFGSKTKPFDEELVKMIEQ